MSAVRIDGKRIAADVRAEVRAGAVSLLALTSVRPGLAVVLVGEDPASQVYVRNKDKAAQEAGFSARTIKLPAVVPQEELERVVTDLNADASVHGILVQMPLPKGLDARAVIERIDPRKDVDGLTSASIAALVTGDPGLRPCTPLGCLVLLDRHDVPLEGRSVVVIGRSLLVGKPFALMALERNATVTVAHSRTRDLAGIVARADVVVAATGKAGLVKGAWIRPGAIVLDVGINRLPDGTLTGDVEYEAASERAAAITPVPGGVGPMTIAMLLSNTLDAARAISGLVP
jgi:methylenetetrahydrofolate dehydrogenase (NADP+)/methenyltetrahydrofolate cyclohydrolase